MIAVADYQSPDAWLSAYLQAQKRNGVTLTKVAKRCGIAPSMLQMLSRGKRKFTPARLASIAKALDLDNGETAQLHALLLRELTGNPSLEVQRSLTPALKELRVLDRNFVSHWYMPALITFLVDRAGSKSIPYAHIAKVLKVSREAVDQALTRLSDAGILEQRANGQVHLVIDKFVANFSKQAFLKDLLQELRFRVDRDFTNPQFYVDSHAISLSPELFAEFRAAQKQLAKEFILKAEGLSPEKTKVFQIFVSGFQAL